MILHKEETLENYLFTYSVIINDTKIKISLSPNDNLHIWNTIPRKQELPNQVVEQINEIEVRLKEIFLDINNLDKMPKKIEL